MKIEIDDLSRADVLALLEEHVRNMHELSPAEHVCAFDAARLRAPNVTFWTAWEGETLLGCAALKEMSASEGEVKSMRTPRLRRRNGTGRALLEHVIGEARARGYRTLYLETGTHPDFTPAQTLYRSAGFRECGTYGDYKQSAYSVCMRLDLG